MNDNQPLNAMHQLHFSQDQSKAAYIPQSTTSSSIPTNNIRIFDLVADENGNCANNMELTFEHDRVVNFFFLTNTKLFVAQRQMSPTSNFYFDIADISTCTGSTCTVGGEMLTPMVVDGVVDNYGAGIRNFYNDGYILNDAFAALPELSFESEYLPVPIEAETNIAVGDFDLNINKFADFVNPQNQAECDEAVESVNRNLALFQKQVKLSFRGLELQVNDRPDVSCSATAQLYEDVVVKAYENGACDFENAKVHIGITDGMNCSDGPTDNGGADIYYSTLNPPSQYCDKKISKDDVNDFQSALANTPAGAGCYLS